MGLYVDYNAQNKLYDFFLFFPKIYNGIICNKFNKRNDR